MKKATLYAVLFSGLALGLASCSDDDDNGNLPSEDNELLRTSTAIDYVNEGDFQIGVETANDNAGLRASEAAAQICASITIDTAPNNTFPKTFTLDFGTGCTTNGVTRSGILAFTLSGPMLENGSTLTVTRNNYYVNGYKVEGSLVFENQTTNPATPQWTRTIANGQITTPSGIVYTHSGTRLIRQIEGAGTLALTDNVFEITAGNHTVARQNGTSLNAVIIEPLIKKQTCANISQGVINLQGTYLDGDLDYGDNNCDNNAVYTHSDGETYDVTLL